MIEPSRLKESRYTNRPWPAYAFRPGLSPHPTESPRGHSYGLPHAPPGTVPCPPPDQWRTSADYLFGCDLYNHGYWWEAHEAWEGLWQSTEKSGAQGRFLQGLIQVSAAHLKRELGNVIGARGLLARSGEHLTWVIARLDRPTFMGLAVAAWYGRVRDYYRPWFDSATPMPAHDPATYPYILLDGLDFPAMTGMGR